MKPRFHIKRTRLRPLNRRDKTPTLTAQRTDIWLSRLSNLSQFGLFLFTIGSIYFTVIPLYKNAALEESIARKEAELKESEKAVEKSYSRIRSYTVGGYVMYAGPECTGLMIPPKPLPQLGQKIEKRPSYAEEILNIDISSCLIKALDKNPALKELREADRQQFSDEVKRIAANLDQKRMATWDEHNAIPERAKKDPSSLKPLKETSMRLRAIQILRPSISEEQLKAYQLRFEIEETQADTASGYAQEARDQITSLRAIAWREGKRPQ